MTSTSRSDLRRAGSRSLVDAALAAAVPPPRTCRTAPPTPLLRHKEPCWGLRGVRSRSLFFPFFFSVSRTFWCAANGCCCNQQRPAGDSCSNSPHVRTLRIAEPYQCLLLLANVSCSGFFFSFFFLFFPSELAVASGRERDGRRFRRTACRAASSWLPVAPLPSPLSSRVRIDLHKSPPRRRPRLQTPLASNRRSLPASAVRSRRPCDDAKPTPRPPCARKPIPTARSPPPVHRR